MSSRRQGEENVVVAVDKDKGSQYALKWTVDNILSKGHPLTLLHVNQEAAHCDANVEEAVAKKCKQVKENIDKDLFLPFQCFCTRKDIKCNDVILHEEDVSRAIMDYVSAYSIETLVLGAPSRGGFIRRFKSADVSTTVLKGAPDFCTVYVIAKGKIASVRPATSRPPKKISHPQQVQNKTSSIHEPNDSPPTRTLKAAEKSHITSYAVHEEMEIRSPFNRVQYEPSLTDSDVSYTSSGRPSTGRKYTSPYDNLESGTTPSFSFSSGSEYEDRSYISSPYTNKVSLDFNPSQGDYCSSYSRESGKSSVSGMSGHYADDMEAEMRRLKLELRQTMHMYSNARQEAITAKQKAMELQRWRVEEQLRSEEMRLNEGGAVALPEKEIAKSRVAIPEFENRKSTFTERKSFIETDEKYSINHDPRYRRYTTDEIEEATNNFSDALKIGEGGYGPVYKCTLDHTPVAIKALRPDAAQGRSQFNKEVEVLSCIRHPNMVLLLGACPEYGCLVYEHMANGSLEDCLFTKGNTPVLSWQLRFRISAEIATGLLFLHQTRPEPLVHRDLKPGNILLDRNYVSKISDVGLARLVPSSVSSSATQYLMTATAGTFCYIDPEYQQTGMLGTKSDVYSLGVMLLQIITAKPPMGLTSQVERAIESGTFSDILDPNVPDWPMEETLIYAKIALQCAELRKRDRPDLGKVVLPILNRLRTLAEESNPITIHACSAGPSPSNSTVSTSSLQDMMSDRQSQKSGYDSLWSNSSTSPGGRRLRC